MRGVQISIRPLSELNGYVDVEISDSGNNKGIVNFASYTVRITKPEPIARFEEFLARHVEDYALEEPFETRLAERVQNAISAYGTDLYNQIKLNGLLENLNDLTTQDPVSNLEICVFEEPSSITSTIHWELLESLPLQQLHPKIQIHVSRVALTPPEAEVTWATDATWPLNILVVVARSGDKNDIPYRNVILPLTNISNSFPESILNIDIVQLGTWEAVQKALVAKPFAYYDIVHFDVHAGVEESRAILRFEASVFTEDKIDSEDVGRTLVEHGVKAVILNACRSAREPVQSGSSIASALLHHGLHFVIGMSYNTHQDAVGHFLRALYNTLLVDNRTVSEAVYLARKEMQSKPTREGRFGTKVDVQDWFNPVLYLRNPAVGQLHIVPGPRDLSSKASQVDDWCAGFYGRDYDIACIEKALRSGTIARIQGFRGAGKSTLMKHLQEWWVQSRFAESVFVVDFAEIDELTMTSFKLYPRDIFTKIDAIITERRQNRNKERRVYKIWPALMYGTGLGDTMLDHTSTQDDELLQRPDRTVSEDICSRLKAEFSQERYIILFNCFDNISSAAYSGDINFQCWIEEMQTWLKDLDWVEWKSMALFSSSLAEEWLNKIPVVSPTCHGAKIRYIPAEIVELEGLDPDAATQLAKGVIDLSPYLGDATSRLFLERILQYYQYQPLALKVVLPHLQDSGLTTKQYFERTLCSEIQLPLKDTGEEKRLIMDIKRACTAATGPISLSTLAATTVYCPRTYLVDIPKADEPFQEVENTNQAFDDEIETYQDFGLVRYIEPSRGVEDDVNDIYSGHLMIHPLFTSYMRGTISETSDIEGVKSLDIAFSYLVYYLAQRSEDGEGIDNSRHPGSIEIERNWFNILAALRYCVTRPYDRGHSTERLFDFIMNRIVLYVADYKQDCWDIIAEIALSGIKRVMNEFSKFDSITVSWWSDGLLLYDDTSAEEPDERANQIFPLWLLQRVIKLYVFLRLYAYKKFDPQAWHYNAAVIGLLDLKRSQGFHHGEGETFLEQDAFIAAAEIAHQSSSHYEEGLTYFVNVDPSRTAESMREHLEIRKRDILAEMVGYVMDTGVHRVDTDIKKLAGITGDTVFSTGEKLLSRSVRALMMRRVYAKASYTKSEKDIERAKKLVYQELELIKDPSDPYTIILHRFICDLFKLEADWNGAIRQLHIVLEFIEFNPQALQSIMSESGRGSYLMEVHHALAECYENLGDPDNLKLGDKHRELRWNIYEEQEKTWASVDHKKEATFNLVLAIQYAIEGVCLGTSPEG
ncbi:hypothetical protein TWF281_003069 [Arthrobotrys megalospora]